MFDSVSEWLMNYLRQCPHFDSFVNYNSQQPEADSIAIVENQGQAKKTTFVNGSFTSTLPFMLLVRVNQSEADEIALQHTFAQVVAWIAENDPTNTEVNDKTSIMSLESVSNLIPETRDESGNITYRAIFLLQYFQEGV